MLLSSQLGAEIFHFLIQQRSLQAAPQGAEQLSQLVPAADRQGSPPQICLLQALSPDPLSAHLAPLRLFHLILQLCSLPPAIPSAAAAVLSAWPRRAGLCSVHKAAAAAWRSPSILVPLGGQPCAVKLSPALSNHHRGDSRCPVLVCSENNATSTACRGKVGSSPWKYHL